MKNILIIASFMIGLSTLTFAQQSNPAKRQSQSIINTTKSNTKDKVAVNLDTIKPGKMTKADSGKQLLKDKVVGNGGNGLIKSSIVSTIVPRSSNSELPSNVILSILNNGKKKEDGTPIVENNIVEGKISNIKAGTEVKIIQHSTNDVGVAKTDSEGNFTIKLNRDTLHSVFVNNLEYGNIKIEFFNKNKSDFTSASVVAQIAHLPNNMGIGFLQTENIVYEKPNRTQITYSNLTEQEAKEIDRKKVTILYPSGLSIATTDLENVGEDNGYIDLYWKILKGSNGQFVAFPITLAMSKEGDSGLGATMRKNEGGTKSGPCFKYRLLDIEQSTLSAPDPGEVYMSPCLGAIAFMPPVDAIPLEAESDIPQSVDYSTGTSILKMIVGKQSKTPIILDKKSFVTKYVVGYGMLLLPRDFEMSPDAAGDLVSNLFENSKIIPSTIRKINDAVAYKWIATAGKTQMK